MTGESQEVTGEAPPDVATATAAGESQEVTGEAPPDVASATSAGEGQEVTGEAPADVAPITAAPDSAATETLAGPPSAEAPEVVTAANQEQPAASVAAVAQPAELSKTADSGRDKAEEGLDDEAEMQEEDMSDLSCALRAIHNKDVAELRQLLSSRPGLNLTAPPTEADIDGADAEGNLGGVLLLAAVREANEEVLAVLLEAKADPNQAGSEDPCAAPVLCSARLGHTNVLRQLLVARGNLQAAGGSGEAVNAAVAGNNVEVLRLVQEELALEMTPSAASSLLLEASARNSPAIVDTLLEAKASIASVHNGITAVGRAIEHNSLEALKRLVEARADVNHTGNHGPPLLSLVRRSQLSTVRFLLDARAQVDEAAADSGETAVKVAVEGNNEILLKLLLRRRADPNRISPVKGSLALLATVNNHLGALKVLLEARADVAQGATSETASADSCAPLFCAAKMEDERALAMLLQARCSANLMQEDGHTPVSIAAEGDHTSNLRILLEARGDPNFRLRNGISIVASTVKRGHFGSLAQLLDAGGDANLGQDGLTPVAIAAQNGHAEALCLLLSAGGNPADAKARAA